MKFTPYNIAINLLLYLKYTAEICTFKTKIMHLLYHS